MKPVYFKILFAFCLFFLADCAFAQLSIMPPVIFIDPATNSGTTTLKNESNSAKEASIAFEYGFINSDKDGNTVIDTLNKVMEKYSLLNYIKAFPKKILIPPFGQQAIKFFLKSGKDLPDGTYWVRFIVTSVDVKKPVDSLQGKTSSIQLDFRLRSKSNSIVVFPKGSNRSAGVKVLGSSFDVDKDNVSIILDMDKTGNSPFWGSVDFEISDQSGGSVILKETRGLQVYLPGKVRYSFPRSYFRAGTFKFSLNITNKRDEVPEEYRIKFSSISKDFTYTVK
jgi:hypothetical protein